MDECEQEHAKCRQILVSDNECKNFSLECHQEKSRRDNTGSPKKCTCKIGDLKRQLLHRVNTRDNRNDGADRTKEVAEEDAGRAVLIKEGFALSDGLGTFVERPGGQKPVLKIKPDPI